MSTVEEPARTATVFALTSAQLGIWNAQRLEPESPYYVVGDVVQIRGSEPVDLARLAEAMVGTVGDAESLRLRFAETPDGPRQWVCDDPVAEPRVFDVSGEVDPMAAAEALVRRERFATAEACRGMVDRPLFSQVIIRLSECEVWYTQLGHHLLFDGYSAAMLARRTAARYTAAVRGEDPPPSSFSPFAEFVRADREYRDSDRPERDRAYWVDRLTPLPEVGEWTSGASGAPSATVSAETVVSAEEFGLLRKFADELNVTWGDVVLASYAAFLHRVLGHTDVVFALPLMCRTSAAELRTPGMAVNVLPLRVEVRSGDRLDVLAPRVAQAMRELRAHQRYRGEDLPRDLAVPGAGALLHGCGVNLKAFDLALDFAGATGTMRNVAGGPPEDMGLSVLPTRDGGLLLGFEVDAATHDQEAVDERLAAMHRLLTELPGAARPAVGQVELLTPQRRRNLLDAWTPPAPAGTPLDPGALLDELATTCGDATALVHGDSRLSYADLAARVHRLARALRARGVGAEDVVALALPRSVDMVVALLAVLDAGAAFLPLDPEHPVERLRALTADARPALLLTTRDDALPTASVPRLDLDDPGFVAECSNLPEGPLAEHELSEPRWGEHLAYVIYTSGSTGTPKGVQVPVAALRALLHHHRSTLVAETARGRRLRVAHTYSFAFDSSLDQLSWLLCGHELHVYDVEVAKDVDALLAAYAADRIDVVDTTPSLAAPLVDAGLLDGAHPLSLLILGGEATPPALWRRVVASGVRARNMYGPTEATVDSIGAVLDGDEPVIGHPLAGVRVYLLDTALQPVGPGGVGELYLAGPQLARGYLNRPGVTAERFVADPFAPEPGARMYRTGDLARWAPGRGFLYLGRADGQVKIRGHRVELGEVEAALGALPEVSAAAAVVRHETGSPRLVGYVVAERGADLAPDAVREALADRLPDHLVPAAVVVLDALPRTVNGKLDRAALPVPRTARGGRPPATERERVLCRVVAEVFGLDEVGPDDDFFSFGGDSISAITVSSRLRAAGFELRPRDLLARRDLGTLARRLVERTDETATVVDEPVGPVPAPPIVRALFDAHDDPSAVAGYAQWTAVTVTSPPTVGELVAGVRTVLDRHAALRLRWAPSAELEVLPADAVDASAMVEQVDLAECTDDALATLADRLAADLDPSTGAVLRVALVLAPGAMRVLVLAHHLVVDGVSWRVLVPDLREACLAAREGRPAALPSGTPGTSWRRHATVLAEQGRTGARRSELDHWRAAADPACRPLGCAPLDPALDTAATAQRSVTVADCTASDAVLTALPAAYRAGPDEVLLAALALALRSWRGARDALSITVERHGRDAQEPGADLSRTVGWFTSEFPVRVPADAIHTDADLRDALAGGDAAGRLLRAVKEARRAVPGSGIGYGVLRHLDTDTAGELGSAPEVVLNYLGRFTSPEDGDWTLPSGDAFAVVEPEAKALEQVLALNCFVHEDGPSPRLAVEWTAARRLLDETAVRELQQAWQSALTALATHAARLGPDGGGLTPSDLPLVRLEQSDIDALERRGRVVEVFHATPLQVGLSFHTLTRDTDDTDVYVVQAVLSLSGELDRERLADAARELLRRQPALRVHLATTAAGETVQVVPAEVTLDWMVEDLPAEQDVEASFAASCRSELDRPFDPEVPPLLRFRLCTLGPREHRLVLTNHHALLDGWSMPLVGRTLLGLYAELGGGPAVPAPPPLSAYHQWLAERDRDAALTAWREALAGVDEGTRLAPATARPRLDRPERVTVDLGEDFSDRLRAFARDHGITVTTVLQTAWGLLLGRLTRRRDVVFGCPVSGRPAEVDGVESMVGQLGNTIPVRVRFDPRQRVGEVLARVHEESVALTEHHHLGLPDIQRAVGVGELFDTMLVMENFPFSGRGAMPVVPGLELAGVRITDATHYPLTVVVIPEDEITIGLGYQPHVFDEDTVRAYGRWLHTILREIVADVDRPVGRVPMLDTEETERMLRLGTGPSTRRRDAFLTEFARWVARKPDAEAVVCRDRRLTYAELDRLANRLAHALLAAGVGQEDPVGVLLGRDVEMIVALFGVLKAGAVYLPLDPNYPAERLAYMVGDARPAAFVTDADALDVLGGAVPGDPTAPVLRVDAPEVLGDPAVPERDTDPAHARAGLSEDSLAYVIYTSGTTGKPKGVAVTHRGIPDLVSLQEDVVGVTEHDRYLHFASTSFDVAFWQTMVPLCSGGTLVVAPEEVRVPGDELLDYIVEHRVTGVNLLPSFLAAMPEDRTVDDDVFFVVGAERLDPELARRWGEGRRALFNAYGPTEVTINSVTWRYQPGESGAAPIGRPDPNVTAYVLDDALQPVGVGVIGELYLGGPKLARGYLGLPGRTAQAFVADPFVGVPGARMYRTGDLVYWRADGQLVFVGRADRQVKIRGFRIELGEIESALSRHPDVRGCAVVVREDRERRLVGYVIPAEGARFDPARLREDLLTELPDHLVPTAFVALDRLPLTPGGKLDEAALPAPERGPARPAREPATRAEEVLLRLVRELVGTDDVTLDDRFLEIGGDSIVSLQLVSRARRHGLHLRPRDVLDGATIAGIAARCVEPDAAADTAVADTTAVVTGDAPLTPVMLDLLRRCADTPGGVDTARDFCQWTELCVPAGGSAEVWREVLDALLARHDVLRAHLARGDGEPVLRIPAPGAVTAAAVLTHVVAQPGEDVRERVDVWLADARAALDLWNGPLLRAMWVDRGADDLGRLVLLAHHLLVDGVSWRIVVDELAELYAAVVAGAPVPSPPARGTSFLGWARALRSAAPGRHAELPHWTRVVDGLDAPPLSDVALDPARDTAATAVHHEIRVAPDLTRALLTTIPAAFHTTPDAVLLTAFLRAVGRWRERTPELVMALESHGRPTHGPEGEVDLSRTVGWFTAVYPAHLRVPGESSAAAVKAVKEQLRAHGDGLGHGILTAAGEPDLVAAPRPQVSWNYLGQFPAAPKTEIPWQAPPGATPFGSGGETLPLPYGLMVDAMAWDDGDGTALRARLTWPRALFTDDDVAALGEEFHQQLVALAGDPELLAGAGHTPSDFPSVTLDQAAVEELERRYAVVDVLPLSPLQQLMLHHTRASVGGCDPYTVQATFSLVAEPGEIDVRALHAAVADLVARHPNLGAAFPDAPGLDAVQVLVADAAPDCRLVDLSHLVGEEQQRAVEDVLERDFAERFDLAAGAPIRLTVVRRAANRAELVLTSHHVLSDGWSAPRMLAEIFAAYTARTTGTAPTWPAPVPFTRYLSWLAERDRDADLTVWQRALAGLGEGDYLVGAELEPGAGHPAPVLFDVDAELVARLTERAAERGLTVGTLVQGAWAAVLAVWSGRTDVCFGTMVSGRTPDVDGVEHVIGLLANTVPVRVRLDGTTAEAFAAVQSRAHDLDGHHAVALSDLERVMGLRRLFDSLLVFENYPVDPAALAEPAEGLRVVGTRFREFTHHPVTVTLVPEDGGWHGVLARRHGALTEADAEALALALQEALRGLASAEMLDADVAVLLGRCERAVRTR
ncbi:non-ribosomal peptide synthetase [Saccharomonospora sp. NB11]|uniref:non-ribosomal peptide synthetase n=1 Tax=Saccharomonospora sp. NB11 TaxID=1642298 RepID=UPI0018D00D3D|nr:non-ribosomal peptide synthetase [Saccharomonospora sp. NB11]